VKQKITNVYAANVIIMHDQFVLCMMSFVLN